MVELLLDELTSGLLKASTFVQPSDVHHSLAASIRFLACVLSDWQICPTVLYPASSDWLGCMSLASLSGAALYKGSHQVFALAQSCSQLCLLVFRHSRVPDNAPNHRLLGGLIAFEAWYVGVSSILEGFSPLSLSIQKKLTSRSAV